jgi:hypothetical protein
VSNAESFSNMPSGGRQSLLCPKPLWSQEKTVVVQEKRKCGAMRSSSIPGSPPTAAAHETPMDSGEEQLFSREFLLRSRLSYGSLLIWFAAWHIRPEFKDGLRAKSAYHNPYIKDS